MTASVLAGLALLLAMAAFATSVGLLLRLADFEIALADHEWRLERLEHDNP